MNILINVMAIVSLVIAPLLGRPQRSAGRAQPGGAEFYGLVIHASLVYDQAT
jgi:hypothetical protein